MNGCLRGCPCPGCSPASTTVTGWLSSSRTSTATTRDEPWQADELDLVLDLLVENARLLTPAPAGFRTLWADLGDDFSGWSRMRSAPPDDLDPWAVAHLDELVAYESRLPRSARRRHAAAPGCPRRTTC